MAAEPMPTGQTTPQQNEQAQQQMADIERWNNRKSSQAQKRIIEHLMLSGKQEDDKETARSRLQSKVKQNQKKRGNKKQPQKNNDYDVEKALRNLLGSEYKPAQNSSKKKKRKRNRKKKQNQKRQKEAESEVVRVKTEEERRYRMANNPHSTYLEADFSSRNKKEGSNLLCCGLYDKAGIQLPKLDISMEASTIMGQRKHLFISSTEKKNLYGLSYQSDSCENICCAEQHYDSIYSYLEAWERLTEGPVDEEEETQKVGTIVAKAPMESSPGGAEEGEGTADIMEEPVAEIEEEEEEEIEESEEEGEGEGYVIVEFSDVNNYSYFEEINLHVFAYLGPDDTLSYAFSRDENVQEFGVFTYIPSCTTNFLKKNSQILKAAVVALPCNYLVKTEEAKTGEVSWSQIQTFILENPETTFLLNSFNSSIPHAEIFAHFDALVQDGMDLSNVTLFLPPPTVESQI